MMGRPSDCESAATDFDAALDGQLAAVRRAHLRAHLTECAECRAAIMQLNGLRKLLADQPAASTPESLSARLTTIAGESSDRPLWMAAKGCGQLSSPRTRRRQRLVVGSTTVLMVTALLLGLGLVLAPTLPTVADAKAVANLEYDLSTGSGPVAGAVSAVQATSPGSLTTTAQVQSPRMMGEIAFSAIDADAAKVLLEHASRPQAGYRGIQKVMLGSGQDYVVGQVECAQQPGEPLTVTVLDASGRPLSSGLLSIQGEGTDAVLPAAAASFQQAPGGQIAGEATTLLEAHRQDGTLLARWWISESLGLVMWSESFDAEQNVIRSAGFVSFQATPTTATAPNQLQVSLASQRVVEPSGALCTDGFTCPRTLAGLPLIEMRADSATHPTVICALYGDGDVRVSVTMRRGHLGESARAYGLTPDRSVVAWQSGSVVHTVTTNAGPSVANAAAAELPHEKPAGTSAWDRATAGLKRLFG